MVSAFVSAAVPVCFSSAWFVSCVVSANDAEKMVCGLSFAEKSTFMQEPAATHDADEEKDVYACMCEKTRAMEKWMNGQKMYL